MTNLEIYIKVNQFANASQLFVEDYRKRVLADGGVYEAGTCLLNKVESLGGHFEFTDVYNRLDLFKDEKISLTSSVQNINDLSKVFTDYTQSFTIPASKNNNKIFNYWNESAVNDGFDQRIRYDAIIELDTIPFKVGQIKIEKCNEKNNRLESYSVTFYGKVKQLKDLFKEDKLSALNYSSLNHSYTGTQIINRIDGTTEDGVYYPIVGNQHKYTFADGGVYDISVGGSLDKSIVYTDLFPAIPVSKVFEFMQDKYGITFTSSLFDTSYWTELYLYCKNVEQQKVYTAPVKINFTSKTGFMQDLNLTTDVFNLNWVKSNQTTLVNFQQLILKITPTNNTISYRLKIKNSITGVTERVFDNLLGYTENTIFLGYYFLNRNTIKNWYFEIESTFPLTFSTTLNLVKTGGVPVAGYSEVGNASSTSQTTTTTINIVDYVPDIKVVDFFNGIIKLFNLTISATSETSFNLEPLEFFYSYGNYIDINSFVINDSVDLERTKLFKKLSFSHEKSENILNNAFRNTFNRGFDYGDLIYEDSLTNESATYEIKTPFEDVMWERTINNNFITTTLIDKDLNPYKPKPLLMYKNGITTVDFGTIKIFNGSGYTGVFDYQRFSNELFINNDIATINFNEEISSWDINRTTNNSLFNLWYQNYISALYDIRCRIIKLKAIIPITMLSDIKLNDKIIYKDKKYIINTFTTDLTTGEVDLELISDFREIAGSGVNDRFALQSTFNIDNTAQDLEISILKLNSESYDVIFSPTSYQSLNNQSDKTFIVPINANTTGNLVLKQIEIGYYDPRIIQYINIIQDA